MSKLTLEEIADLIEAVNMWGDRYRCHFCSSVGQYEKRVATLRDKLFAMRDTLVKNGAMPEKPRKAGKVKAKAEKNLDSLPVETLEVMMQDAIKEENYEFANQIKLTLEKRKKK